MASKLNYFTDFYEEEILNGTVPELYIDNEILTRKTICYNEENCRVYKINENVFYEVDRNENDFQEFRLELINNDEDYEELIVEIIENSFGVIVNSVVLLSYYHWNTILNEYPTKCLVCDTFIQDANIHIKTDNHKLNLEKYKPLKKFDLHITRLNIPTGVQWVSVTRDYGSRYLTKIGDKYHCAVCNEAYEKYDNTHLDDERHLEKMLYATNRALDVIYDSDINNDNRSETESNEKKIETFSVTESYYDSDVFYDANDFTNTKSTLSTYASVTKQSKTQTPTSVTEQAIDNKTFTIDTDTYHMIIRPNTAEFYCMLCQLFNDIKNTSEHCNSEGHLKKLKECETINKYKPHFIRKVTSKFYHCGTCNNLQLAGAVEAHLETHERKQNQADENEDKGNEQNNKDVINKLSDKVNAQESKTNEISDKVIERAAKINEGVIKGNEYDTKRNENNSQISAKIVSPIHFNHSVNNINPNIYNDIIINSFNCNIRVSFMSYNFILRRLVDFVCLLCNFVSPDMTIHLKDARHIVCLKNFPFQPFFGIHLVRIIRQYAHCAICNVLVDVGLIHLHTALQTHLILLNKALNSNNNIVTLNQTNIDSFNLPNTKISVDLNIPISSQDLQEIVTNNTKIQECDTLADKNETIDLNQTEMDSDNLECDIDDDLDMFKKFVYLIVNNCLVKISYTSYHSLVHVGDGTRYCFICSHKIKKSLFRHINSKAHRNSMKECKFLIDYNNDLIRQVNSTYHCCFCNVLVQESAIKNHLIWPVHRENVIFVKKRKRRTSKNKINVQFQTKEICFNDNEKHLQLLFNVVLGEKNPFNIGGIVLNVPPNEEHAGKMLNIMWEAWQGITRFKNGVHCNICKDYFTDIDSHLDEDGHKRLISKPIEKQYLPACIRKINDSALNCVTCNVIIPNKKGNVTGHLDGKKHLRNYKLHLETAFKHVPLK